MKILPRKYWIVCLFLGFTLNLVNLSPTLADLKSSNDCEFNKSNSQPLYLGSTPDSARFAGKVNPRILVIPYVNIGEVKRKMSQVELENYNLAKEIIFKQSSGSSSPSFSFVDTIQTDLTPDEFEKLIVNGFINYPDPFDKQSIFGFVRREVRYLDKTIDFSGFDGVILQGFQQSNVGRIDMAMLAFKDSNFNNGGPIHTDEREIWNASVMNSMAGSTTIAHEVLHMYGLPDLYGSGSGPGEFSMMATGSSNLFNFEKLTLGWFPKNLISCYSINAVGSNSLVEGKFDIPMFSDSLIILKIDNNSGYVIESHYDGAKKYLWFYYFETNIKPPMIVYQSKGSLYLKPVVINSVDAIGNSLWSPDFILLVSNLDSSKITLDLIKTSYENTDAYSKLQLSAKENQNLAKSNKDLVAKLAEKYSINSDSKNPNLNETSKIEPKAKLTTIKCAKGKVVKTITSNNPKCPVGYKKV